MLALDGHEGAVSPGMIASASQLLAGGSRSHCTLQGRVADGQGRKAMVAVPCATLAGKAERKLRLRRRTKVGGQYGERSTG
eukprot:9426056-Prorocentrum_lima.AAC.1